MNARINQIIDRAKNPRDENFRKRVYIFLICVGISLFIWFLIKMSDEYVAEFNIPLEFTNLPADKILNDQDQELRIRLKGEGGDLFSLKYLSPRGHIIAGLNELELKKSRYFDRYYILTRQLRGQVEMRFDFEHELLSIEPDTIFLYLEDVISKSLPVLPNIQVGCKAAFMLYDSVQCKPDRIMVSGPASMIDTLDGIKTMARSFTRLDQNTEATIPLILPVKNKKIQYSDKEVKVIIPVEEFTESIVKIPVNGISEDSGYEKIRTFPAEVELTYRVALKDFQRVKAEMFQATALYTPELDKDKTFLKVRIKNSPDFVHISRIDPERVEFIIEK